MNDTIRSQIWNRCGVLQECVSSKLKLMALLMISYERVASINCAINTNTLVPPPSGTVLATNADVLLLSFHNKWSVSRIRFSSRSLFRGKIFIYLFSNIISLPSPPLPPIFMYTHMNTNTCLHLYYSLCLPLSLSLSRWSKFYFPCVWCHYTWFVASAGCLTSLIY